MTSTEQQRYIDVLLKLVADEGDVDVRRDLLDRLDRVMLLERIERVLGISAAVGQGAAGIDSHEIAPAS